MAAPTPRQLDYLLQLANALTGERARYNKDSSIDLTVKTGPEATAMIDALKEAIPAHQAWQEETGLTIGSMLRHHYTTAAGTAIIAEGPVTRYRWSGLRVSVLDYDATPETRKAAGFSATASTIIDLARLGAPAAADPEAELEAEREKLLARLAEVDSRLAALRA